MGPEKEDICKLQETLKQKKKNHHKIGAESKNKLSY